MGRIRMMRAIHAPARGTPSRPQVLTAAAGGLAEASFLVLPVYQALTGAVLTRSSMPLFVGIFLIGYAGGVGLVCRYRTAPPVSAVVAAVAIGVGAMTGGGATVRSVYTVVVFLLLGARLLMLGFRDWDEPFSVAFLVGTLAIGGEALVGSPPPWSWGPPLLLLVPIFFAASLAGRAVNVWTSTDADDLSTPARDRSLRRALSMLAWIPVAGVAGVILGVKGGSLDRLGSLLAPIGTAFASLIVWAFAQLARPFFWLVEQVHLDPEFGRRLFANIKASTDRAHHRSQRLVGHPSPLGRLIALILIASVVWGLVRLLRRIRPDAGMFPPRAPDRPGPAVDTTPLDKTRESPLLRSRRVPPADRVRRWYLDTLTALEQRGLAKAPALTPAEFVPEVIVAYPSSANAFRALTRAYEDVRYGRLTLDRSALRRLDGDHRSLLATIRRQPPAPADR